MDEDREPEERSQPEAEGIEWDFGEEGEVAFMPIPPGTYLCRVEEARSGLTRSGHKRWALKYVVHSGPETGRLAAWDGLVFSPKAAWRTRQVLAALGLPHRGKVRLSTSDLVGRKAFVTVEEGSYRHPDTGQTIKRLQVTFGGVRPADGVEARGEDPGGMPF